jgi:hypothetical protein
MEEGKVAKGGKEISKGEDGGLRKLEEFYEKSHRSVTPLVATLVSYGN